MIFLEHYKYPKWSMFVHGLGFPNLWQGISIAIIQNVYIPYSPLVRTHKDEIKETLSLNCFQRIEMANLILYFEQESVDCVFGRMAQTMDITNRKISSDACGQSTRSSSKNFLNIYKLINI